MSLIPTIDIMSRGADSSPLSTQCQIYNKERRNPILESRCKSKRGAGVSEANGVPPEGVFAAGVLMA